MNGFRLTRSLVTSHSSADVGVSEGSIQAAAEKAHPGNGSGEIKKRLAEDCRRKSDICGSGISRAPLRGSGRHNRRSNSVEAGTTQRKSSRRRSPHDLGSADLATWLRETRPSQARSSNLMKVRLPVPVNHPTGWPKISTWRSSHFKYHILAKETTTT
ncbi:hypothetical protein HPB50_026101 [Hyalomma asiaticum]|uniref:Uncharacterized protein n=1 Tax=Hyalomma asiaticum TaxID=266040 RepID=A0ACB7TP19_HYAAI|nr:hypothetical protein HPB50_026101 [Hyalomma asiaticum]